MNTIAKWITLAAVGAMFIAPVAQAKSTSGSSKSKATSSKAKNVSGSSKSKATSSAAKSKAHSKH